MLPKAASQRSSPKFQSCCPIKAGSEKAAPRCCSPKLWPKAVLQSCCPKAAILQTCLPKRLPKAILQSGSRKLRPKIATTSCSPKLLSKAIAPKSIPQKRLPKAILQSGSRKLLPIVAAESCSPKLYVKLPPEAAPKAAVLESKCSSKLFRKACQSCSLKRFPEVASQSCFLQSGSRKLLLPKVAAESCSPSCVLKLLPAQRCSPGNVAVQSSRAKLLLKSARLPKAAPKSAPQSCYPKLFPKFLIESCSEQLLSRRKLFPKPASHSRFLKVIS